MTSPLSRKSLRRVAAIATLTLAGGLGVAAFASPHGGGGMMPLMGRGMERMLDGVNATPEQRAQIEQIRQTTRDAMQAEHESGRALRDEAMALFTQPTVDANAAEALRQKMLARHDRASQRRMQSMLEISRVLTPEQRQQIAEHMTQRSEMHQRHHGERKSMGQPAR